MNVLSLFDGMSCGQLALDRLGIKVKNYYASEIDKYAIEVTKKNYPKTKHLGDVRTLDLSQLPKIDLLLGGSPCQNFSFAGSRKGMATKEGRTILELDAYLDLKNEGFEFDGQSYLFWEYVRIYRALKKINPEIKFLLENVVMSKNWESVISKQFDIHPIKINSSLVSAQNRQRLYWTNIGLTTFGLFSDMKTSIKQPKDKGILLPDVLQDNPEAKYYLTTKAIAKIKRHNNNSIGNEKSNTIHAGYYKQGGRDQQYICEPVDKKYYLSKKFIEGMNLKPIKNSLPICVAMRGRNEENPSNRTKGISTKQRLEPKTDGKTNCLTTVQKDNLIIHNTQPRNPNRPSIKKNKSAGGSGPLSKTDGKSYCLDTGQTTVIENITESLKENDRVIRRLTPIECERLQTVPDNYTAGVSDTQRYKMLGNGWTIDVICHILKHLNKK